MAVLFGALSDAQQPDDGPEKADHGDDDERQAPAPGQRDEADDRAGEGSAERSSGVGPADRGGLLAAGEPVADQLVGGGPVRPLAHAEDDPDNEQGGKTEHGGCEAAEYRPDDRCDAEHVARAQAVGRIAADEAERCVADEEHAEDDAEFGRRQPQFLGEERRRDGQSRAVQVVDHSAQE